MVSGSQKNRIDKTECLPYEEHQFVESHEMRFTELRMRTDRCTVSVLRDRLMATFNEFDLSVDTGPMQICMAIEEALANAFYHGNLELDSSLKEDGTDAFMILARERCEQAPFKDRQIYLTELATPYGMWLTIRDEGIGFDVNAAIARLADPVDLLASGRGLMMMKSFSDELIFNQQGNEVTLVFYNNKNQDVIDLLRERSLNQVGNDTSRTVV